MESRTSDADVREFSSDRAFFDWLGANPDAFVLNVEGKKIVLHRASCTHINRHNNLGALTERGAKKIGADTREALNRWSKQRGLSNGIILPKCRTCM